MLATDLIQLSSSMECGLCYVIKAVWTSYFSFYDQIYLRRSNIKVGRDLFWLIVWWGGIGSSFGHGEHGAADEVTQHTHGISVT